MSCQAAPVCGARQSQTRRPATASPVTIFNQAPVVAIGALHTQGSYRMDAYLRSRGRIVLDLSGSLAHAPVAAALFSGLNPAHKPIHDHEAAKAVFQGDHEKPWKRHARCGLEQ